jgi:23S rRNA pseudouridine1911/1915/1917 synthase
LPFVKNKFYAKTKQKAFLFLIRELNYTQKEAQRLIAKGRLLVDGEPMTYTSGFVEGEFEFIYFEPITKGLSPLFQTKDFVLFDKPSGVLIHPQSRNTPYSLLDEIKYQFGMNANITHRIDQETSGIVLAAKNKESERDLKIMFQERKMQKYYLAFVHGKIDSILHVNEPLLRKQDVSAMVRTIVKVHPDGKLSETIITPLKYFPKLDMTLVEAKPLTGRQHQIRVHLFHVKHPIVGDPIYAQSDENILRFLDREISPYERIKLSGANRLLLHANKLEFHYKSDYSIISKENFIEKAFSAMKQ